MNSFVIFAFLALSLVVNAQTATPTAAPTGFNVLVKAFNVTGTCASTEFSNTYTAANNACIDISDMGYPETVQSMNVSCRSNSGSSVYTVTTYHGTSCSGSYVQQTYSEGNCGCGVVYTNQQEGSWEVNCDGTLKFCSASFRLKEMSFVFVFAFSLLAVGMFSFF